MRKILLASTALVALTSVSAMAADVTISGSYAFKYTNDDKQSDEGESTTTDAGSLSSESDVNIKFSNTTDSGLTTTLNYGFDEGGNAAEDLSATLSGDFGTLYFDSVGDDGALGGFDEKADLAGEGDDTGMASGYRGGIMGTSEVSVGWKLPTLVEGMSVVLNTGDGNAEYFGYGVGYSMGGISIGYVKEADNTVENTSLSVGATFGDITIGADSINYEAEAGGSDDRETLAYGVSYKMGDITLAYEMGSMDDGDGTELENHSQLAATYAVASGITAVVTTSEIDSSTDTDDQDAIELQLKLSF